LGVFMKASRTARFADVEPRAELRVALRLLALAALLHTPAAVLAQAGTGLLRQPVELLASMFQRLPT